MQSGGGAHYLEVGLDFAEMGVAGWTLQKDGWGRLDVEFKEMGGARGPGV